MSLGVHFSADIAQILQALAQSGSRRGTEYHAALLDVAVALGCQPPRTVLVLPVPVVEHETEERKSR